MSNVGELCKISIPKDPKRYVTLASADKHGFLAVIAKKNFRSLRYVDFLKGANIVHYNEPGSDYIHCFNGVSQDTRFQPTKVFIHTHYNLWKEGTHVRFDENLLSNLRSAEAQYREGKNCNIT